MDTLKETKEVVADAEIAVTDDMLQAAGAALYELVDSDDPLEWRLTVAYKAMAAVARKAAQGSA